MNPLLRRALRALGALPGMLNFVGDRRIGAEYGVSALAKVRLLVRLAMNSRRVETLSTIREHVELAGAILSVPAATPGAVVECGCYLGGSSANLSLACALVGRRLVICDSFEGLPRPKLLDQAHYNPFAGNTDEYYEGRFAASMEAVRANIDAHGELGVCEFHEGFFDESLADLDIDITVAFLDVDLIDSLKPCLRELWPRMRPGCRMYIHEARSLSLVSIFFDGPWWREHVGVEAPGLIGAGSGLPLTALSGSELGFAVREPSVDDTD